MTIAKELKAIHAQMRKLRERESRLQDADFEKRLAPQLRELPGKTFVYRNNSSGGKERWDVFRLVRELVFNDGGCLILSEDCAIASEGRPELEINVHYFYPRQDPRCPFTGWVPCPYSEYEAMRTRVGAQFASLSKLIAAVKKR